MRGVYIFIAGSSLSTFGTGLSQEHGLPKGPTRPQMRLDAGAAHGVLQTSKFAIFSEDTGTSSPLIENVGVQHVNAHETILCLPSQSVSNLPSIIFAKVIPSESVTVLMETSELARTIELNPRDCLG